MILLVYRSNAHFLLQLYIDHLYQNIIKFYLTRKRILPFKGTEA
jgi:hypothetical protein